MPLKQWKEEALQFVAQSRSFKSTAPAGEREKEREENLEGAEEEESSPPLVVKNTAISEPIPLENGDGKDNPRVILSEPSKEAGKEGVKNAGTVPKDTKQLENSQGAEKKEEVVTKHIETKSDPSSSKQDQDKENEFFFEKPAEGPLIEVTPSPPPEEHNHPTATTSSNTNATSIEVGEKMEKNEIQKSCEEAKYAESKTPSITTQSNSEDSSSHNQPQASSLETPREKTENSSLASSNATSSSHVSTSSVKRNASSNSANSTHAAPSVPHADTKTETVNLSSSSASSTASPQAPAASKSSKSRRLRKNRINYASHDCGAKVLASNGEAVDPSAVLVGSKDRYMLNPCSAVRQFIVIELCESVGVDHIQLGNFEFFSSMIKDVQVLASNRYPTPSWAVLGNFTLSNERELQSLDFGEESELHPEWFKYLQIRILSHWGNEYYCPITEIQVHGLPYVEKLQRELRQNSRDASDLESRFSAPSLSDLNAHMNAESEQFGLGANGHAQTTVVDTVITMAEYLAQHTLETTEHFNSIYNTSLPDIQSTPSNNPSTHHLQRTGEQKESSRSISNKDYDVVHPGISPPPPKIGGDDELEDVDDEEDCDDCDSESQGGGKRKKISSSSSSPPLGASVIPTMNLIQMIVQRVKKIEIEQSLVSSYLDKLSGFSSNELSELGEALAELNHHFVVLRNFVSNKTRNHDIWEAKVSALTENLHSLQNQLDDDLPKTFRIYLIVSGIFSLAICVTTLFTIIILFRCLPIANSQNHGNSAGDLFGRSMSSNSIRGLERSNSDYGMDFWRRSGSFSGLEGGFNLIQSPTSSTPTLQTSDQEVMTLTTPPPSSAAINAMAAARERKNVKLENSNESLSSARSQVSSEDHLQQQLSDDSDYVLRTNTPPYGLLHMNHEAAISNNASKEHRSQSPGSIAVRDVIFSHMRSHSEPNDHVFNLKKGDGVKKEEES